MFFTWKEFVQKYHLSVTSIFATSIFFKGFFDAHSYYTPSDPFKHFVSKKEKNIMKIKGSEPFSAIQYCI